MGDVETQRKKTYIKSVLNSAIALCLEEKSNQKEEKENEEKNQNHRWSCVRIDQKHKEEEI